MQQIYLDNASTTFPKPQAVADAVYQYITPMPSPSAASPATQMVHCV